MVKIRLRRIGRRNKPFYRVVIADSRSPRDGKFIDIIGHYNPLTDPPIVSIDGEKALKWLGYGAQPTDTVRSLLKKLGIMDKVKPTSGQN
jgi:small subunit ribosomal protein S16